MKKINHLNIFLSLGLIVPLASAAQVHPVINAVLGADSASVLNNTTLLTAAPFTNTYAGTNAHNSQFVWGFFLGGETELSPILGWQYGARYFQSESFNVYGNVYQFSDPMYNNFTYQYQIRNRRVLAETKLFGNFKNMWHPFGIAALGGSFNQAYSYHESPLSSTDVSMTAPFSNKSTTSFSYSLGLGLDYIYTNNVRIGMSYRWSGLGKVSLGTFPLQESSTTIQIPQLKTNEFLVEISYVV